MIINAKYFWKKCIESYIYAHIHMSSSVPHSILLRRYTKQSTLAIALSCCPRTRWYEPIAEDSKYFGHRTRKHHVGTDQEISSILDSFLSARK